MDRLMSMRVFQRVMDEGSFAAAARAMDMSPAVVTRLVADLEEHLGARLLHRSTRKLALTDAGDAYLRRVRTILQDIDEADALASAHTRELAGTLRILCQPALASHVLAPLLVAFRGCFPQVAVELTASFFAEPSLEEHDIALFVTESDYDGDIIARKIVTTQIIFVAAPTYLRRKGTPQSPQDLHQHDCLRFRGPNGRTRHWQLRSTQRDAPPITLDIPAVLCANHIEILLRAALDGCGITVASVEMVAPYLASGQLVQVLPDWIIGELILLAALPTRKFLPQRTRVFLDFLTEQTRQLVSNTAPCRSA